MAHIKQNPNDWRTGFEAGFAAAKEQAAKLARMYADERASVSSEKLQLDPGRHKPNGLREASIRWVAETAGHNSAIFIAASIEAMQPPGTALPIEKIAAGFPTDGDCPESGALALAEYGARGRAEDRWDLMMTKYFRDANLPGDDVCLAAPV